LPLNTETKQSHYLDKNQLGPEVLFAIEKMLRSAENVIHNGRPNLIAQAGVVAAWEHARIINGNLNPSQELQLSNAERKKENNLKVLISVIEQLDRFEQLGDFSSSRITKQRLLEQLLEAKNMSVEDVLEGIKYFDPYASSVVDYTESMRFVWTTFDRQNSDPESRSKLKFLMSGEK
jgi:hypothetical protein